MAYPARAMIFAPSRLPARPALTCARSTQTDGRWLARLPSRAGQGSVACIDRTFQRALRRPLERGAVMMAHPFRALARAIFALVALVPGALEGRMWMRMGPRAVTCLSDSDHWRERENRTESHDGDCLEHFRLRSSTWLIKCNLVKGSPVEQPGVRMRKGKKQ
jgi:hypothetical protein